MDPKKVPTKRFLLFGFDRYYPGGGWNDFLGSFDTAEEAREFAAAQKYQPDCHDVIDTAAGESVWQRKAD
jgi:hypothetical protein